jgi:hypothetical protein
MDPRVRRPRFKSLLSHLLAGDLDKVLNLSPLRLCVYEIRVAIHMKCQLGGSCQTLL